MAAFTSSTVLPAANCSGVIPAQGRCTASPYPMDQDPSFAYYEHLFRFWRTHQYHQMCTHLPHRDGRSCRMKSYDPNNRLPHTFQCCSPLDSATAASGRIAFFRLGFRIPPISRSRKTRMKKNKKAPYSIKKQGRASEIRGGCFSKVDLFSMKHHVKVNNGPKSEEFTARMSSETWFTCAPTQYFRIFFVYLHPQNRGSLQRSCFVHANKSCSSVTPRRMLYASTAIAGLNKMGWAFSPPK